MSNVNGVFENIADDIVIISSNCKITADSFGQAYNLVNEGTHIVKVSNQPFETMVLRRNDGSCGVLADFVTNFRTLSGQPLGHLDTKIGKVAIPRFWPTNAIIQHKYGLPCREGQDDIMVDAFVVNNYWRQKIYGVIDKLPEYPSSGF